MEYNHLFRDECDPAVKIDRISTRGHFIRYSVRYFVPHEIEMPQLIGREGTQLQMQTTIKDHDVSLCLCHKRSDYRYHEVRDANKAVQKDSS